MHLANLHVPTAFKLVSSNHTMTNRSVLKASALALLALVPATAEPGSDVAARMQALERQVASLSQQVQNLEAPPQSKTMEAPSTFTILSRTVTSRGKEETQPTSLNCGPGFHMVESSIGTYCAPNDTGSRNEPSREVNVHSFDTFIAPHQETREHAEQPVKPVVQVRNVSPKNAPSNRDIFNEKLEELSQMLPDSVPPLNKGKTTVLIDGVTLNIHVPASGSSWYLYAPVGTFTDQNSQEQFRIIQTVVETLELDMDSLSVNPETNHITYSRMENVRLPGLSAIGLADKLTHFAEVVKRVAELVASEL